MTPDLDTVSVVLAAIPAWVTLLALAAGIVIGWSAAAVRYHRMVHAAEVAADDAEDQLSRAMALVDQLQAAPDDGLTDIADAVMQQRTQPDMLAPDWTPPLLHDPRGGRHERR